MGQYFMWLNPVKGQYIEPIDFDHGNKRRESSWVGCEMLDALFTLMDNEWKNDPIVWIGDDYARLYHETNPTLKITEEICGRTPEEYASEHFEDISSQFTSCDRWNVVTWRFHKDTLKRIGMTEEEIDRYFDVYPYSTKIRFYEYKFDDNRDEFVEFLTAYLEEKGMFKRKANRYRFIINNTKKEFIDTDAIIPDDHGYKYNPFPALMIKEDDSENPRKHEKSNYCSNWLGDSISVGNDPEGVPDDFEDVSNKYTWENGY